MTRALAATAGALGILAYLNALQNPFVFDDKPEIVENISIRALGSLAQIIQYYPTRPLTNLSYALDYALSGVAPIAYHVTSLMLHAINVMLLFAFVRRAMQDVDRADGADTTSYADAGAFVTASLLAVHPMMTESVGYTSSRAEVLCATFFVAALLFFREALVSGRRAPAAAGVGLFLLAVMSKETAVVLPLVLVAYDRLILRGSPQQFQQRLRRIHAPMIAAVAIVGAARIWLYLSVEHPGTPTAFWDNLVMNLYVTSRYLGMLVFPYHQTIVPPVAPIQSVFETRVMVAAALLALLIRSAYVVRRRLPVVTYGTLWFLMALAPSAALLLLADRGQPMAEHRVYLASFGFFMAVGGVVPMFLAAQNPMTRTRVVTLAAGLALALGVLMALTVARNRVWSDPVTLWEEAARRAPRTWVAHFGAADAYRQQGNLPAAAAAYERVIALSPNDVEAYLDLADVLIDLGQYQRARQVLQRAVMRSPVRSEARLMLAALESDVFDDPARALALCQEIARTGDVAGAENCTRRAEQRSHAP